jgi:UDP-N-acetylmuramoyl-tripeptide--D-alanyl-D-alanine ligase
MTMMTLAEAQALIPGAASVGEGRLAFERVHSDTRTLRPGDLFVALRGERFDAHDFLPAARASGAVGAIAERGLAEAGLPGLQVPDALTALQTLAAAWRGRYVGPLIAVTGSNGKTTVTQMIASILRAQHGDAALATQGNLNNHIGVPLTLLRLRPQAHRAAVLELGMNHPGEIALLARIAAPTIALVNNAQREHQEFIASVEAVARENGSVLQALPRDGVAVFPADDAMASIWREMADARQVLTFAIDAAVAADFRAQARWDAVALAWDVDLTGPDGGIRAQVHLPGEHNVRNALAAAACARAAGVPWAAIARGLDDFHPVAGRSQLLRLRIAGRAVTLVDDSYNANPDSVLAAIDVLCALPAPRWLVLGDMAEVGDQGPAFHAEVGARARDRGVDELWCSGEQSLHTFEAYGPTGRHFDDVPGLIDHLGEAPEVASILIKGSRSMRMERVVQALVGPGERAGSVHAA